MEGGRWKGGRRTEYESTKDGGRRNVYHGNVKDERRTEYKGERRMVRVHPNRAMHVQWYAEMWSDVQSCAMLCKDVITNE